MILGIVAMIGEAMSASSDPRLARMTAPNLIPRRGTVEEVAKLACFLASPKHVLSRERLLDLSRLHNDEVYDRSIDVQVNRLRRKLKAHGAPEDLISTERGAGYVFTAPVEIVR